MDNKKNEDLQSRREFFKTAAKATLPILGAVVLSHLPIAQAKAASDCDGSCWVKCNGNCIGQCTGSCRTGCEGTCVALCRTCCN